MSDKPDAETQKLLNTLNRFVARWGGMSATEMEEYEALRRRIEHGPEVSRGFVVNSARAMHVEPDALRICLEEAGVTVKEAQNQNEAYQDEGPDLQEEGDK